MFFFCFVIQPTNLGLFFITGKSSQWKGTVLDQVPVNPSLYLIKYDGFDCIYGLELYSDERVVGLEVLPDRVGKETETFLHLRVFCKLRRTFGCQLW